MSDSAPENKTEPLKILMTADAAGGVWRYTADLARGLADRGAEVLVACMGPRPPEESKRELLNIPRVRLVESDFALEWMPNPWQDVEAAGKWLMDLASAFRPDIVHLNGYSHANLPWRKPVVVVGHSCVFSWWRAVHGCAPGEEWAEYKRRVMEGLSACDVAICPSKFMARALEEEYGTPREKIQVIYNSSRAPQADRRDKRNFILAAGRMWDEGKNLRLLEQIAPQLAWEVCIADGARPHAQLLDEMRHAGIFAHPALYEPFGLAVLEAARQRCCLVLSDIPSLREIWANAAIFVDPRDPNRWAAELSRLCESSAERESMAARAFARAAKFRESASEYWKLYRSMVAANLRPGKGAAA